MLEASRRRRDEDRGGRTAAQARCEQLPVHVFRPSEWLSVESTLALWLSLSMFAAKMLSFVSMDVF
jgi:hypothetical protein